MTEETILQIIRSKGTFQINPFNHRNAKVVATLRKMEREGRIKSDKRKTKFTNYTLKE